MSEEEDEAAQGNKPKSVLHAAVERALLSPVAWTFGTILLIVVVALIFGR